MSSVVVSGDSSSDGESSDLSGVEGNPIEIDDSTSSRNSESNSEAPPGTLIYTGIDTKIESLEQGPDPEPEGGNPSGEDGGDDDDDSERDDDSVERTSESADGDDTQLSDHELDRDDDCDPPPKPSGGASDTVVVKAKKQKGGEIESMLEIQKSPYEGNECAEVGEDCFEELRTLMHHNGRRGQINPKIVALLGEKLATALCNAHYEIGKSGILYSANWREGRIRDSDFGWIPKRQLLLCLHEHRFARGSESLLQAVARSLDCTKLVIEAMDMWNLTEDYPNLVSTRGEDTFVFGTQKVSCYKCEIFVAKAFATLHILNKTHGITQSLTKKIKECLIIMNKHVRPNQIVLARVQNKTRKKNERVVVGSNSRKSEKAGSRSNPTSSGCTSPATGTTAKPARRNRHTTKGEERETSKRRRKVQKSEEREESLLMMFDNMHTQAQRLNQMMSFFQTQLRDHRSILREEITENMSKDTKNGR